VTWRRVLLGSFEQKQTLWWPLVGLSECLHWWYLSTFGAAASLAFNPFTIPSNPCFARLYPSSRPKSIPLAFPSSNISSISLLKFCSKYFRPFSYPSSYARFHNKLRFSLSDVEVVAASVLRSSPVRFFPNLGLNRNRNRFTYILRVQKVGPNCT
jgi:hypothetical protein